MIIGKHRNVPDSSFDPRELRRGIEVELEHTDSRVVAKQIARDHLAEIFDYYSRLDKMEASATRKHNIDCRKIMTTYKRARQFGHDAMAKKALKRARKYRCEWVKDK